MKGDQGKKKRGRRTAPAKVVPTAMKKPPASVPHESLALLQALREREEQLSLVLEAAEVGTWDWDIRTGELSWSSRCFELFGLPPDAAISYTVFLNALHPDDRERIDAAVKSSISEHREYDVEMRAIWPDGSIHWISSRGRAYCDLGGQPIRMAGVALDISNRKLAEEKLRVSEEKFVKAFSENPAAIAVTRLKDGTFLEVNDTWTKLTEFSREESIGVSAFKLAIWADPNMRDQFVAELRKSGALRGFQPEFKKKSGESFFAEVSAQILTIGGEEVVLSTLIDITERKRAEEELRLSNERFQVALKNSSVVVFNQDLDLRYTWIYNPALGYDLSEVIGKRDVEVFDRPEDAAITEAIKRDVIDTGVPHRLEVLVHWLGSERYYDLQVEPLRTQGGQIIGVTCAAIDITDRKHAEAAMLRSEKLASVGRMAATVAHEINNPLEAVMNSIFLAQMETTPDSARKHLKIADEELRRVAHIARQSLGFYRDRSEPVCTSATLVLNSAVDLLKNKIKGKNAIIRKRLDEDFCVHAVPNELRQVFGNLVANSLDAIAPGGIISMRTRRYTRPDGTAGVRITISDNGAGIPSDILSRVFEPLFTTKRDVGTGLGLWVSKQIIEKHGGSVRLRSRCEGPLRGTTIVICMPECSDY